MIGPRVEPLLQACLTSLPPCNIIEVPCCGGCGGYVVVRRVSHAEAGETAAARQPACPPAGPAEDRAAAGSQASAAAAAAEGWTPDQDARYTAHVVLALALARMCVHRQQQQQMAAGAAASAQEPRPQTPDRRPQRSAAVAPAGRKRGALGEQPDVHAKRIRLSSLSCGAPAFCDVPRATACLH